MRYYTAQIAKQAAKKAAKTRKQRELDKAILQATRKQGLKYYAIGVTLLFCAFVAWVIYEGL